MECPVTDEGKLVAGMQAVAKTECSPPVFLVLQDGSHLHADRAFSLEEGPNYVYYVHFAIEIFCRSSLVWQLVNECILYE